MEQNMEHIELFTKQGIFIPQISIHYNKKIVKNIFKLSNIGYVDTVEFIPLKENEEQQSAIVYFENVILSDFSYQLADTILNEHSYNLYLEDDECWVLLKNKNPSSERAIMNEPFSLHGTKRLESKIARLEETIAIQNDTIKHQAGVIDQLMYNINYISQRFDAIVDQAHSIQTLQKATT